MWLSQNMIKQESGQSFQVGVVTANSDQLVVSCADEFINLSLSGPRSMRYKPQIGDKVLIANAGDQAICAGVLFELAEMKNTGLVFGNDPNAQISILDTGDIQVGKFLVGPDGSVRVLSGELRIGNNAGTEIAIRPSGEIQIGNLLIGTDGSVQGGSDGLTIQSASGARIVLCADGTIQLNNVLIGNDGTVTAAAFLRE